MVEARVCYTISQKCDFEERYNAMKIKREKNLLASEIVSKEEGNSDEQLKQLNKISKEVDMLESSLTNISMIKGNLKSLQKIRHDLQNKMAKL